MLRAIALSLVLFIGLGVAVSFVTDYAEAGAHKTGKNNKNCVVNQREVNADTHGFAEALRSALRQDPDVVLVGELRDLETIEMALRVAETGHLTFATLHTNSAASTINRIIDVFPAGQQSQIRTQLSLVLEGIIVSGAAAEGDGRRARNGAGNPDSQFGYSQSYPRRQNSPNLFYDADRTGQIRYADV